MESSPSTSFEMASEIYDRIKSALKTIRSDVKRPLTFAEKLLGAHLVRPDDFANLQRGISEVGLRPDRVALQDATAQMAILQFMTTGLEKVLAPTTIHCDHLIAAQHSASTDLETAKRTNKEVYDFLQSAAAKYGIGFWEPGSGIIHQVVLEQYAIPGLMLIGTDSHTPNAGGCASFAVGVGGADAVDVLVGMPFSLKWPKLIGVELTGSLNKWTSAKDVILRLAQLLTVKGGTGSVVEYFGSGVSNISATGRATICNMGAEIGATTSVFGYDQRSADYLRATGRTKIAELADALAIELRADEEVESDPKTYFDSVVSIDLSELEPRVVGPHSPDRARTVASFAKETKTSDWPAQLSAALVGSCTNSSYEDITRAASVAQRARQLGLKTKVPLYITPGSERVYETVKRDGLLTDLEAIGAVVLANACGPCIGMWKRTDGTNGASNSIISSFNRNFPKRNDGNPQTSSFISSPEVVVAYAIAGRLDVDPFAPFGSQWHPNGIDLPPNSIADLKSGFIAPREDRSSLSVKIDPNSDRLAELKPFSQWNDSDFVEMPVLLKAIGKCTTDHISAAGPWLKFRGHLDNISNNLFISANNAFCSEPGTGVDFFDGSIQPLPDLARSYNRKNRTWCVIADENYGEGSSREHAAMEPRHLGGGVVIARSFARIHETNLKKQGLLPLTFDDPNDYDKIESHHRITIVNALSITPGELVTCSVSTNESEQFSFLARHSFTPLQLEWFKNGSALNAIRIQTDLR